MVRVYTHFINKKNIKNGIYNAGFENLSILNLARKIKEKIDCSIKIKKSNDSRSYRLDSTKLLRTGFQPKYSVEIAIDELVEKYNKKKIIESDKNYTVRWMKKLKF
jgi:nucleoside-diphosphate-sugar epimerase|tara:strand:+ start:80 stop:397 length:318 start_codon:yes stop_codon:yes gene_type:complete